MSLPLRSDRTQLGRRSSEALAVLEMYRREWSGGVAGREAAGCEPTDREGAVAAVRAAVRAGILNDLGSGSHVDICCIDRRTGVSLWRERMRVQEDLSREVPVAAPTLGRELLRFGAAHSIGLEDADCSIASPSDTSVCSPRIERLI